MTKKILDTAPLYTFHEKLEIRKRALDAASRFWEGRAGQTGFKPPVSADVITSARKFEDYLMEIDE